MAEADARRPRRRPGRGRRRRWSTATAAADWDERARRHRRSTSSTTSRRHSARRFGRARDERPAALRLRRARRHHDLPRHLAPACGCGTSSRPAHVGITGKSGDLSPSAWVGAGHPRLRRRRRRGARRRADPPARLGRATRRPAGRPLRHRAAAGRGGRPDDLRCTGRPAARDAYEGRTVFSEPGGGTRVGELLASQPVQLRSDPAAPGLECAPFVVARPSATASERVRQRPAAGSAPTGSATASCARCCRRPAHRRR